MKGKALSNITVSVKGTGNGTFTNAAGQYRIMAGAECYFIV